MWYFSTMTAQFTLQQCLQHILNIYIRYCLQLHYTVYCLCYYICYTFHNMIFFNNYCTIDSTTMSTAYPQHIHTILFTITLPSILTLLFIYASFTQCDIFSQLLHYWLYNNVYSISSTYTHGIVTITLPSILTLLFIYASFTQCDIFSQWLHNSLYNNVYSISSTYTYGTVYNYTTQLTVIAITYAILFTIWYFFTITAQLTLQQCLQHILNIYIRYCLQLKYPVYWLCCLCMLPLHNVTFFHNYCTIDSTTMSTAYP